MTYTALCVALLAGPVTEQRARKALRHLPQAGQLEAMLALMHPPEKATAWRAQFVAIGATGPLADATGTP